MVINPGRVLWSQVNKFWNFTVVVDGVEKVGTSSFESPGAAKAAMRSFVDGARFVLEMVELVRLNAEILEQEAKLLQFSNSLTVGGEVFNTSEFTLGEDNEGQFIIYTNKFQVEPENLSDQNQVG